MPRLITLELEAPPDTVDVLVDFYDEAEKAAFMKSPMAGILKDLPATLKVPTPDLCAYYLYYKKRQGVANHSTYQQIARQWPKALAEFDGQIEFADSSIKLIQRADSNRGTTERIGEAIGLVVSSQLHSLHQADWTRIPESTQKKTLDFWHPWIASDGKQFIQLETKGSATENTPVKSKSVKDQRDSIRAKKREATDEEKRTSVLYGTISVLDDRPGSVAQCWLVDPPAEVPDNPERFKIVTRLSYIANLISVLAPSSNLAASLQTRLSALSALNDIGPLDELPLLRGNGESFSGITFGVMRPHNPLFQGKSVVIDGPVGGQISVLDKTHLFFFGMREELVGYVARQRFDEIQKYRFTAASLQKSVECVIPNGRFKKQFVPLMNIPKETRRDSPGYVRFRLQGQLHYTQSGLVFGVLPIPEDWQIKKS